MTLATKIVMTIYLYIWLLCDSLIVSAKSNTMHGYVSLLFLLLGFARVTLHTDFWLIHRKADIYCVYAMNFLVVVFVVAVALAVAIFVDELIKLLKCTFSNWSFSTLEKHSVLSSLEKHDNVLLGNKDTRQMTSKV